MNHYIQNFKDSLTPERKHTIIGAAVILGIAVLVVVIALLAQLSGPKITYQPVKACDLLTPAKAQDLLGDKVISADKNEPAISGNVATSKCSYTDENPDKDKMLVAAIAVRSGINDEGVEQNKTEFASGKPKENAEDVKGLGEKAYFNTKLGQLNILDGKKWIILSYGTGSAPQANTMEDATKLAKKVLN